MSTEPTLDALEAQMAQIQAQIAARNAAAALASALAGTTPSVEAVTNEAQPLGAPSTPVSENIEGMF